MEAILLVDWFDSRTKEAASATKPFAQESQRPNRQPGRADDRGHYKVQSGDFLGEKDHDQCLPAPEVESLSVRTTRARRSSERMILKLCLTVFMPVVYRRHRTPGSCVVLSVPDVWYAWNGIATYCCDWTMKRSWERLIAWMTYWINRPGGLHSEGNTFVLSTPETTVFTSCFESISS